MPQALLAVIPALIAGGTTVAGLLDRPHAPKAPPPAPPPAPTGPTTDQARAAITPQALSIEALTGGSVSPEYLATVAPLAAGVGGQPNTPGALQKVLQDIFGTGGGGTTPAGGTTPGSTPTSFTPTGLSTNLSALAQTPGLSDFLQKVATAVT